MRVKDFLTNKIESIPKWLEDYKPGSKLNINLIKNSRLVYYPGSGYDGQAIRTFNEARYSHVFLYVDYGVDENNLIKILKEENAIKGYHLIGLHYYDEKKLVNNTNLNNIYFVNKENRPYCLVTIFERNEEYDESHGSKRFVLIYLFADAIEAYKSLFIEKKFPISTLVIQDHGFGGNYDKFGRDGLMESYAKKFNVYPEYICVEKENEWHGYELIENLQPEIGGMWANHRYLYIRNNNN